MGVCVCVYLPVTRLNPWSDDAISSETSIYFSFWSFLLDTGKSTELIL